MITTVSEAEAQAGRRKAEQERKDRKRQRKRFKASKTLLAALIAAPNDAFTERADSEMLVSMSVTLADKLLAELDKR